MIRIKGVVVAPNNQPMEYSSIMVQTIGGSLEVLPATFAYIALPDDGSYDFHLLGGTYRIYATYRNSQKIDVLGECTVSDKLPPEVTINRLVTNHTPVAPDWVTDFEGKWDDLFNDLINDVNTRITAVGEAVEDGDASAIRHMATYVNEVTGQTAATLTDQIKAGDSLVMSQAKAYTDTQGNELASHVTGVQNSVSKVSTELSAYKKANGDQIAAIEDRIEMNEATLGSDITAEVNGQTGAMELRISNYIDVENASIKEDMDVIKDDLGNLSAHWQVVSKVDDLTSSIGMVNDGKTSSIYLQAKSLILTNDNKNVSTESAPFYVENDQVYISSAYIKKLTGEQISSNTTILAGSGEQVAGMNGNDTRPSEGSPDYNHYADYRFWAGAKYPAAAPFSVDKTGYLRARGGNLKNLTIEEDCTIKGVIYVDKIIGESFAKIDLKQPRGVIYTGSITSIKVRVGLPVGFDRYLRITGLSLYASGVDVSTGTEETGYGTTTRYRFFNVVRHVNGVATAANKVTTYSADGTYLIPANSAFELYFTATYHSTEHANAYAHLGSSSGDSTVGCELYRPSVSITQG